MASRINRNQETRDWMSVMPVELVKEIMGSGLRESTFTVNTLERYVAFEPADVYRWSGTSKYLRSIACGEGDLWRKICIEVPWREPTPKSISEMDPIRYRGVLSVLREMLDNADGYPLDLHIVLSRCIGNRTPGMGRPFLPANSFLNALYNPGNRWRSLTVTTSLSIRQIRMALLHPFENQLEGVESFTLHREKHDKDVDLALTGYGKRLLSLKAAELWLGSFSDEEEEMVEVEERGEPWRLLEPGDWFPALSHMITDVEFPFENLTRLAIGASDDAVVTLLPTCSQLQEFSVMLIRATDANDDATEQLVKRFRQGSADTIQLPQLWSMYVVLTEVEPWFANVLALFECPSLRNLGISLPAWTPGSGRLSQRYTYKSLEWFLDGTSGGLEEFAMFPSPEEILKGIAMEDLPTESTNLRAWLLSKMPHVRTICWNTKLRPRDWPVEWKDRMLGWTPDWLNRC
ncbi:hypothetical protein V5O48_011365 [Marasmius crinis-equi]|uniref:F-box domain-containing protein n=1 Tax=Marasmius crinis-equi TaxID=585013 RepID=A0ABR3F5W9_9AGAR